MIAKSNRSRYNGDGRKILMEQIDINRNKALRHQAKALYHRAFPKEECAPWWLMRLNARRRGIDLTAWVEDGAFCGITASVTTENMHYLWYFAVAEEKRGRGVGSKILEILRKQHPQLALNVEPLIPDAPNYPERVRRLDFYRRNGLTDTGWDVWEVGGQYRILSDRPLDAPEFKKVFKKLSFGFWNVKMKEGK